MPSPGMRFGRYELLERLGAGGMGEVFRARDHDLQRDVAIKFLPERFADDPDRLARFTREALAASSLNHPNIVTVHEIGRADQLPYMVIEFVDGETLRKLLERPLPVRRALDLAVQLADGLAKAHAAGIVHRDLKPENVMVNRDGVLKILDFGLARTLEDTVARDSRDAADETRAAEAMTTAGAVLGTVGYMSPEQARGEPADHRSDQFAFGAVLYEMATGRRAFSRPSAVETLAAILERDPDPPITSVNPEFPAPAAWAAERCLSKDPAERYASTQDLARELRSVRDHVREATSPAIAARRPTPRGRRRWLVVLAAAALASIVAMPILRNILPGDRNQPLLSEEKRVVVLPIQTDPSARTRTIGLLEYIVLRLAELNRFDRGVSVVPATEVIEAGVKNPSAAGKRLGATLAVAIDVGRAGPDLVVSIELSDATHVRALKGDSLKVSDANFSPERVVELIVKMLAIELKPADRATWGRGVPGVVEAAGLFAQGLAPYQQARLALESRQRDEDLKQAIALFNQALELDPHYAAAYAGLGEAHLLLYRSNKSPEDFELAEKLLRKALELDETRPSVWIALGMAYTEKGQVQQAEEALKKAIATDPAGADAYRELGNAYARAGDDTNAETSYRKAIEIQSQSVAGHSNYGEWLYRRGRYDEALAEFSRALPLAPNNRQLLSNMGGVYARKRQWDKAEEYLTRAKEAGSTAAVSNLAYIKFQQQRYAEAADDFEEAARSSGRNADMWRNAGSARYKATHDRDAAAPAYRTAAALLEQELKIDRNNPRTLFRLADCYAMLGRAEAAREATAKALRGKPTPEDRVTAAEVYEEIGDREKALTQIQAALEAGIDLPTLLSNTSLEALRKDDRFAAIAKTRRTVKSAAQ